VEYLCRSFLAENCDIVYSSNCRCLRQYYVKSFQ